MVPSSGMHQQSPHRAVPEKSVADARETIKARGRWNAMRGMIGKSNRSIVRCEKSESNGRNRKSLRIPNLQVASARIQMCN
mmetsp:Transcript_2252/g.4823  ORF Transcript_2252/g.4823 Transcript_2252/m.4823 type:complete len:81 (-) Transcript_2252:23-265(-)